MRRKGSGQPNPKKRKVEKKKKKMKKESKKGTAQWRKGRGQAARGKKRGGGYGGRDKENEQNITVGRVTEDGKILGGVKGE